MESIICIVGPTASGKSSLAQGVALKLDGEVVSADSMQIYKGMDIGTGKVLPNERLVRHHCLDIVDPGEPYSVALFQKHARQSFENISNRGKRAILCGGTGFYIRAAIDAYDFPKGEQANNPIREAYWAYRDENGVEALWLLLKDKDPASAAIIPENDVKRVIRAFELLEEGTSYAEQKERLANIPQLLPARLFGLMVDPKLLAHRIDSRVDKMVEEGLVDEVKGLLDKGFREGITSPQAIGYKEIVEYLDGNCTLEEALDAIKLATRRYAKRQRTWFRKDKRITWIDADDLDVERMTDEVLSLI